jgi:hypothetical protein
MLMRRRLEIFTHNVKRRYTKPDTSCCGIDFTSLMTRAHQFLEYRSTKADEEEQLDIVASNTVDAIPGTWCPTGNNRIKRENLKKRLRFGRAQQRHRQL